MASWGDDGRRLTVVLNDNAPRWYRGVWRWVVVCVIVAGALFLGGRRAFATDGVVAFTRCAIVDVRANKVVGVKQGDGDTIIRVWGYVDNGDNIEWTDGRPWRFARRLVTRGHGTGLRYGCR